MLVFSSYRCGVIKAVAHRDDGIRFEIPFWLTQCSPYYPDVPHIFPWYWLCSWDHGCPQISRGDMLDCLWFSVHGNEPKPSGDERIQVTYWHTKRKDELNCCKQECNWHYNQPIVIDKCNNHNQDVYAQRILSVKVPGVKIQPGVPKSLLQILCLGQLFSLISFS